MRKVISFMLIVVTVFVVPLQAFAAFEVETVSLGNSSTESTVARRATRITWASLKKESGSLKYYASIEYNVYDGPTSYEVMLERYVNGSWVPYAQIAVGLSSLTFMEFNGYYLPNPPTGYYYRLAVIALSDTIPGSIGYSDSVYY